MSQPRRLRIPLRVVFYREGEFWIAHCLEFDLLGDGATQEAALKNLTEAIDIQVQASIDLDTNLFSPADGEFFEKFAAGANIIEGELTLLVDRLRSSSPMIEDVTAREYHDLPEPVMA